MAETVRDILSAMSLICIVTDAVLTVLLFRYAIENRRRIIELESREVPDASTPDIAKPISARHS